ncbi:MAG: SUMF1/EgtB/PvdO family nonheme iron enzyme [Hyphomicrobiaceae bacterium]|nr:SUMF1/EgtB/PvdO family nonheme iron enzyme [Hyphomicrobiaceae bacterium]
MTKIFISYRRDDSAGHAGRVHDRLEREFGRDLLFMDVDAIPLGANFVKVLGEEVGKCDVLLAIIGPSWLDAKDEDGNRRLENPHDFVRIEIATALTRDIPVIPILLEGTRVPKSEQLPDDLKELSLRNGLDVRHASFHNDMDKLIRGLRPAAPAAPSIQRPPAAHQSSDEDRYRTEGRILIDAPIVDSLTGNWFLPGDGNHAYFKDHEHGPEMVVVPAGSFVMGSPDTEERWSGYDGREEPQHTVTFAEPLAVGRHAVTRGQFAAFVNNTSHKMQGGAYVWTGSEWKKDPNVSWASPGFTQDDSHPVVCLNWDDAKAYADWLSKCTDKPYRLLSEAEWEYVARAGTTTPFWWGSSISTSQANYDGNFTYGSGAKGEYRKRTVPVGEFEPNPWGLYQVHGNAWEWCEDVWHDSYNGAPADGSAWLTGGDKSRRVVRGGSWDNDPRNLRAAYRDWGTSDGRIDDQGFRLARTLNP